MHGLISPIERTPYSTRPQNGYDILEGIPEIFKVTRYHSLIVDNKSLPDCIEPICVVQGEETLMGLAHRELPYFGVQFHPESICTEQGANILDNFRRIAIDFHQKTKVSPSTSADANPLPEGNLPIARRNPETICNRVSHQLTPVQVKPG